MGRFGVLAAVTLLLLGACAATGSGADVPAGEPEPAVSFIVDETGPWRELPIEEGDATVAVEPASYVPPSQPPVPVSVRETARPPALAVPARRATPPPRELGTPPPKSPQDLARERFLDHPTRIKGRSITFYCPQRFLSEVRLTGEEVTEPRPGRRIAKGNARLLCRELLLEGEKVVLRVKDPTELDVQITARGGVSFVTNQRGQVLRQEDVRILLIKNDGVTPLR